MTELDREARSLIELARHAEGASPEDRARVRQRVQAALGLGAAAFAAREVLDSGVEASFSPMTDAAATSGAGVAERVSGEVLRVATGSAVKAAGLFGVSQTLVLHVVALLVGGAVVGGGAWFAFQATEEPEPLPMSDVQLAAQSDAASTARASSKPAEEVPPSPQVSPRELVPQPEPLRGAQPVQLEDLPMLEPEAPAAAHVPVRRGAGRARGPLGSGAAIRSGASQADAPNGVSLADEARELSQVQRALRAGEHSSALARLDEMDRRPGSALLEERLAARVLSLCGLGRLREAESVARRVQSLAPESPLLPRLSASCAKGALRRR